MNFQIFLQLILSKIVVHVGKYTVLIAAVHLYVLPRSNDITILRNVIDTRPCVVEWSLPVLIIRLVIVAWRLPHWPSGSGGGVILGRPVAQKIEWEKAKKFCEVCHVRSELPVRPANYDKMRLLGLHIACQYDVHINIACIIRSLVCCCCYDLKFTLAEYFKPTFEDIFQVFFFLRKKMKSPCPQARINNKWLKY